MREIYTASVMSENGTWSRRENITKMDITDTNIILYQMDSISQEIICAVYPLTTMVELIIQGNIPICSCGPNDACSECPQKQFHKKCIKGER